MYSTAYLEFLHYFHCDRDYFECHEVLEEHWKERPANERELYWVGLIQIAVGLYHHRRSNFNGAKRMFGNAKKIIESEKAAISKLALDSDKLLELLQKQIDLTENCQPYTSIDLPITDTTLLQTCQNTAQKQNKVWGSPSDLSNTSLIHKHSLRNREDVINERVKQLKMRQQTKEKDG
ncbi:DUF309 domain-containing protein [Sutcliffiella deserti]|uniref:DUF309 domain-containing protein n=1 Tax=Sutcliffiella deserti TaxID=2875501 RepID=UPI001CC0201E|nr:DUF309 domain-containing protein [Sutcliffiella deserti]